VRTGALLVEAGEGVADHVLGVGPVQLLPEHGEEHGEVDGSRGLGHHGLQVAVRRVLTWGHTDTGQQHTLDTLT